jgi:hypothetical protein
VHTSCFENDATARIRWSLVNEFIEFWHTPVYFAKDHEEAIQFICCLLLRESVEQSEDLVEVFANFPYGFLGDSRFVSNEL